MTICSLPLDLEKRLAAGRAAARLLRSASTSAKNRALAALRALLASGSGELLAANRRDLDALPATATRAFRDRLELNGAWLALMAESLAQVEALPDPVGEELEARTLANGLRVRRVRAPLGVIFMIFESRPNVAVEAFSLAFKAGNVTILRGGKESARTVEVLYRWIGEALAQAGLPRGCCWGISDPDRLLVQALLTQRRFIDVVVPRGGDSLIEFVAEHSSIPIIKNDRGLCHVYVHEDADLSMAREIVVNAKTQRPGVCNAMETLLVHRKVAPTFLAALHADPRFASVEWFGCPETARLLAGAARVAPAGEAAWDIEYLDLRMNCRVIGSLDEAIAHIERHGSRHSEAIVTGSPETARRFREEIDTAAVYSNASTRFTDGFELGLGGELGISTQKLHVRGPVGLRELTSARWVIEGNGQVRS